MRKTIAVLALPFVFAAACSKSRMDRDQRQYEVVQEGAASGVTTTIGGTASTVPLTGTNADTTTAFTLDPRTLTAAPPAAGGTIAQTAPPPSYGSAPAYPGTTPAPSPSTTPSSTPRQTSEPAYSSPRPAERTQPAPTTTYPSQPRETTPTETASQPTETAAPPTETTPPPATDTTTTRGEQPKKDQPRETPPPTQTDTAPPPTTTDTASRGN